jgi:putative aldouronate transport system permease protein
VQLQKYSAGSFWRATNNMMQKKSGMFQKILKHKTLVLMSLPAILITFFLSYIPMAGIIVAFKRLNYKDGLFFSPWVGLDNFRFFVISGRAALVTLNTVVFNIMFITAITVTSIVVALLVSEMQGKYFKKVCQSFMFLPFFISWVVVNAFMYNIFNVDTGILNSILKSLNMQSVNIYSEPWYWYIIMPILRIWKFTGYNSVLYLAAIMGIDGEYYEAATIDGANRFKKIYHITLPLLKPTIIILLLLSLGSILRGDFDMFYNVIGNNSMIFSKTDVIDTFVFRSLVSGSDIGMSSAAALFQSVVCFAFITITNGVVRKANKDYALF